MADVANIPRRDANWATKEIRRIVALGEEKIVYTDHALERMEQRGFVRRDVENALTAGHIANDPEPVKAGFKCKVTRSSNSGREYGVVTVIKQNELLIVVTVEWEDVR